MFCSEKRSSKRGDYPIGVQNFKYKYRTKEKFKASCSDGSGKSIYLGLYDSAMDAFNTYKNYKENLIKNKNKNKENLP